MDFDRLTKIIIELQEKETIIEYVNEISKYFIVVYQENHFYWLRGKAE